MRCSIASAAVTIILAQFAWGVMPATWRHATEADFTGGQFETTGVSSRGEITIGREIMVLMSSKDAPTVVSAMVVADKTLWAAFQDGKFQGASYYDGIIQKSQLIASIGGKIYRVSPMDDFKVYDITPSSANSSRLNKAWFCQAEEFMLIQDGQSKCIVYDGSNSWRLSRDTDLPVGTAMAYGMGRVWVALPDGFSFVAGDLVYGSSGTAAYGFRDACLSITENDFLNEGGAFAMPANSGGICSIR